MAIPLRICVLLVMLLVTLEASAISGSRVNFITAGQETTTPASLTTSVAIQTQSNSVDVWVEMSSGSDTFELVCWQPVRSAWISVGAFTGDASVFNDASLNRFTPGSGCSHLAIFRQTSTGTVTTTGGNPRAYIVTDISRTP